MNAVLVRLVVLVGGFLCAVGALALAVRFAKWRARQRKAQDY